MADKRKAKPKKSAKPSAKRLGNPPLTAAAIIAAVVLAAGIVTIGVMNLFCTDALYTSYTAAADAISVIEGLIVLAAVVSALYGLYRLSAVKKGLTAVMVLAFILRVLSALFWKIEPQSDFLITLRLSRLLADNPVSDWAALLAREHTIYTDHWAAHMPFIIWQSLILRVIPLDAAGIRLINALISWLTALLTAQCAKRLYSKNAERLTWVFMGLNPTIIFFIPVLTNQHISCFLVCAAAAVYFSRMKPTVKALCVGALIGLSQLMRPELTPLMLAALLCLVVNVVRKKDAKTRILRFIAGAALCLSVIFAANTAITNAGLTQRSIYSGNLKYKIAVGLNRDSAGTWTAADSTLIYDDAALNAAIKERVQKPWRLVPMLFGKAAFQFGTYAYTWSFNERHGIISQLFMRRFGQALMCAVCAMAVAALVSRRKEELMPVYFALAVYAAAYAVIEVQNRYNFLFIPFLVLIAVGMAEKK